MYVYVGICIYVVCTYVRMYEHKYKYVYLQREFQFYVIYSFI